MIAQHALDVSQLFERDVAIVRIDLERTGDRLGPEVAGLQTQGGFSPDLGQLDVAAAGLEAQRADVLDDEVAAAVGDRQAVGDVLDDGLAARGHDFGGGDVLDLEPAAVGLYPNSKPGRNTQHQRRALCARIRKLHRRGYGVGGRPEDELDLLGERLSFSIVDAIRGGRELGRDVGPILAQDGDPSLVDVDSKLVGRRFQGLLSFRHELGAGGPSADFAPHRVDDPGQGEALLAGRGLGLGELVNQRPEDDEAGDEQ